MIALFTLFATASCLIPQYLKPNWEKYVDVPKLKDTIVVHCIEVKNVLYYCFSPVYRGLLYAAGKVYRRTSDLIKLEKRIRIQCYNKVMNFIAPVPETKSGFDNAKEVADLIDSNNTNETVKNEEKLDAPQTEEPQEGQIPDSENTEKQINTEEHEAHQDQAEEVPIQSEETPAQAEEVPSTPPETKEI